VLISPAESCSELGLGISGTPESTYKLGRCAVARGSKLREGKIMQMVDGLPRRNRIDCYTPAESAIRAALLAVEEMGAHTLLTEAVVLLDEAREKVADFVELPDRARYEPTTAQQGTPPDPGQRSSAQ
jgi:hypothetical protein